MTETTPPGVGADGDKPAATPTAPQEVPDEMVRIATEGLMGLEVRRVIVNVWPEIERRVREQVAAELRADADAHRQVVARKPSKYDEARLARAQTLDDAAARVSGRRA